MPPYPDKYSDSIIDQHNSILEIMVPGEWMTVGEVAAAISGISTFQARSRLVELANERMIRRVEKGGVRKRRPGLGPGQHVIYQTNIPANLPTPAVSNGEDSEPGGLVGPTELFSMTVMSDGTVNIPADDAAKILSSISESVR